MKGFCLEVSGPFACFTRPEMKVERVSYDVMTPSAARAIFDAILWKPAIRWRIKKIEVLAPIRWISVRRNEVGKVASPRSSGIFIDETNDDGKLINRQQRAGLLLRDVKYRLYAEFIFIPPEMRGQAGNPVPDYLVEAGDAAELRQDETPAKYAAMFERRAKKGQCFTQPYLGCREFSADFRLVDPESEPAQPIAETTDLGWMLYDLDFSDPNQPKPLFFRAQMNEGVILVPDRENTGEVRG
jgi:CRISPR-associated protein Cas5d